MYNQAQTKLIYTYACVNLKQIPADMVVNAMLVAMVSHANQPCDDSIYHVGSSVGNPVRYESLRDYSFRYFTAKPCFDKEGKAIKVGKVTVLENMNSFQRYMYIRYLLPLKVISNPHLLIFFHSCNTWLLLKLCHADNLSKLNSRV